MTISHYSEKQSFSVASSRGCQTFHYGATWMLLRWALIGGMVSMLVGPYILRGLDPKWPIMYMLTGPLALALLAWLMDRLRRVSWKATTALGKAQAYVLEAQRMEALCAEVNQEIKELGA